MVFLIFCSCLDRLRLTEIKSKEKSKPNKKDKKNPQDVKSKDKKENQKKKKKRAGDEDTAENRMAREMEKVALLQARLAKRKTKLKKISTVYDKASKAEEKGL